MGRVPILIKGMPYQVMLAFPSSLQVHPELQFNLHRCRDRQDFVRRIPSRIPCLAVHRTAGGMTPVNVRRSG